jgi:hypothetical protein
LADENATYQKTASGQPLALEQRDAEADGRRFSPSIGRNKDIVRDTLLKLLPSKASVLEIASGTGEHGAHMIASTDHVDWTYSDIDPDSMNSQAAWALYADSNQLRGPVLIDTTDPHWGDVEERATFNAVFCANMIHIAPFEAAIGLFKGASRILKPEDQLILYGPFARNGDIAPSNQRFREDLQRRDPNWGVRDLEIDIVPVAQRNGFVLDQVIEMPANNLTVRFLNS